MPGTRGMDQETGRAMSRRAASTFGTNGHPMNRGVRTALWILSGLAVLWTISTLVMVGSMGGIMEGCPMCRMMSGSGMMTAGADSVTMGAGMIRGTMPGMMWMMLSMGLGWLVMLGLDAVFVYLIVGAARHRRMTRSTQ